MRSRVAAAQGRCHGRTAVNRGGRWREYKEALLDGYRFNATLVDGKNEVDRRRIRSASRDTAASICSAAEVFINLSFMPPVGHELSLAQEDRARPAVAAIHPHGAGRRLPVRDEPGLSPPTKRLSS